ncbi:kelch domain-containing protein 2-like [Ornithodoros turicata]
MMEEDDQADIPKPSRRTGHVAASYKNGILVWGGYRETMDATKYLPGDKVWFYDTFMEKWFLRQTVGNVPQGTSGAVAVVSTDQLFIFGGFRGNGNTNRLYRLNLNSMIWELMEPLGAPPTPCDKMVGWCYKEKLYFFGGFGVHPSHGIQRQSDFHFVMDTQAWYNRRGWSNQFVEYDVVTNTWNWPLYKGKSPVPRAAHAAAQMGELVYVFGGRHLGTRLNDLHVFDNEAMAWSGQVETTGRKPCGRSWHSFTGVSAGHIVLYGGFSQSEEPLSDCWLYLVGPKTWVQVEREYPPRLWHSACLSREDEVVVFGGCAGNIFGHTTVKAEDTIILLQFSPRSLYLICLEKVSQFGRFLQPMLRMLPPTVSEALCQKYGSPLGSVLAGC